VLRAIAPLFTPLPCPACPVPRHYAEDIFESTKMTFGEHLEELRWTLIKAIAALSVGFLIALLFAGSVVDYIQTPLRAELQRFYTNRAAKEYEKYIEQRRDEGASVPADQEVVADQSPQEGLIGEEQYVDPQEALEALARAMPGAVDLSTLPPRDPNQAVTRDQLVPLRLYHYAKDDPRARIIGLAVHEPFVVYMKAAVVLGAVLASPLIFYFIWQFVAAGLYPHEKRYVHVFLPFSIGLFLAGVALAFFFALGYVVKFLFTFYDWMNIDPDPRISDWLSFVFVLPLGFGISFQLPLVMLFLERIGVFSIASYLSQWRMAVMVICVLSMVLTPSDPWSMTLMAVPLIFLYFGGIALCRLMPRAAAPS
jgi:sec-independent protein translocase protein TatC